MPIVYASQLGFLIQSGQGRVAYSRRNGRIDRDLETIQITRFVEPHWIKIYPSSSWLTISRRCLRRILHVVGRNRGGSIETVSLRSGRIMNSWRMYIVNYV